MFRVKRVDTNRIAELGKPIRKSANRRDLTGFDTGVQQRHHARVPPTLSNLFEVLIKIPKNDVTVTVNQGGSRHKDRKRAFRPIVTTTMRR